jgi:hypothetical protein
MGILCIVSCKGASTWMHECWALSPLRRTTSRSNCFKLRRWSVYWVLEIHILSLHLTLESMAGLLYTSLRIKMTHPPRPFGWRVLGSLRISHDALVISNCVFGVWPLVWVVVVWCVNTGECTQHAGCIGASAPGLVVCTQHVVPTTPTMHEFVSIGVWLFRDIQQVCGWHTTGLWVTYNRFVEGLPWPGDNAMTIPWLSRMVTMLSIPWLSRMIVTVGAYVHSKSIQFSTKMRMDIHA